MLQSSANGLYYSVFNLSFFISIELYVSHPYLLLQGTTTTAFGVWRYILENFGQLRKSFSFSHINALMPFYLFMLVLKFSIIWFLIPKG